MPRITGRLSLLHQRSARALGCCWLALALTLGGCAGSAPSYEGDLPSGAHVSVNASGALRVSALGHELFALPAGRGVEAHFFDTTLYARMGFYTFEERDLRRVALDQLVSVARESARPRRRRRGPR